jgi:hypothetical protein
MEFLPLASGNDGSRTIAQVKAAAQATHESATPIDNVTQYVSRFEYA